MISRSEGVRRIGLFVAKANLEASMDDSLVIGKLTIMLLRASIPQPDALPSEYGVILQPGDSAVTPSDAVTRLAKMEYPVSVDVEVSGKNIVIRLSALSPATAEHMRLAVQSVGEGLDRRNETHNPDATVEIRGYEESITTTVGTIKRWLSSVVCQYCSLSLGGPVSSSPPGVIAVLYMGS